MLWRKFNGDTIELPIKDAVEQVIIKESDAGNKLKVCIGTDSQVKGKFTEFATVIVFFTGRPRWIYVFAQRQYHTPIQHQRKNVGGSSQKH